MNSKSQYSAEDCVDGIRKAASALCASPDVASYLKGAYAPSYSTVLKHFGSWSGALRAADLNEPKRLKRLAAQNRRVASTRSNRHALKIQALAAIETHMHEHLDPIRLAELIGTTPARLRRAFSQLDHTTAVFEITRKRVERSIALLETQQLTVPEVAQRVGYSYSGLIRTFNKLQGESPSHYQRRKRMERAARLLVAYPDLSITEIGLIIGTVGNEFTKIFKRFYGQTPLSFRRTALAKLEAREEVYAEA